MKQLAQRYFDAWNLNSITEPKPCLSDTVTLEDWEISKTGLQEVLDANQKIFDDTPGISVTVENMDFHNNTVIAQITVDAETFEEPLAVLDVLTIDDNKITSIKAFKR